MGFFEQDWVIALQPFAIGFFLLLIGGEFLVRGAISIANYFSISKLFVGLLIVSIGTSAPEFILAFESIRQSASDVGVGVVIGSSLINVLLLMGLAAVLSPILISGNAIIRDGVALLLAAGALIWSSLNDGDVLSVRDGGFLLGGLVVYVYVSFLMERGGDGDFSGGGDGSLVSFILGLVFTGLGGAALFFGAEYLINASVEVGRAWSGGSNAVLGLTVLAFGTALPELVAITAAGLRRQTNLMVGTLMGASIINILGVLGGAAVLTQFFGQAEAISIAEIFRYDLWTLFAASAVLLPFMTTGQTVSRLEGLVMLLAYGAFLYYALERHPSLPAF